MVEGGNQRTSLTHHAVGRSQLPSKHARELGFCLVAFRRMVEQVAATTFVLSHTATPFHMTISPMELESHKATRIGWLRAAVLGANDGIVSTASLIIGVAAAHQAKSGVLLAGVAGLVAGAMSMAAGEYVSVSSQADTESADLARERKELEENPAFERAELADIYVKRGLEPGLAAQVADQLMAHDALGAHARDEIGISEVHTARPVQAALASAATFAVGAALPLVVTALVSESRILILVALTSLISLAALGGLAAQVGGASAVRGAIRVTFWGVLAMVITALVGQFFGATPA